LRPDQWRQVSDLLASLLDCPASERAARLAGAGISDPVVRHEVRSLLEERPGLNDFLETPPADPLVGVRLGSYLITGLIAHGGMSTVYSAASSDRGDNAQVAVKVLRTDRLDSTLCARFEQEIWVLSRLEHSSIARLLDCGRSPDGRPYLAMEYVEGEAITRYCAQRQAPREERIRLFKEVCRAVHYAHESQSLVHRDLKPSNVLVRADGTVKLLDFGVAKLLGDGSRDVGSGIRPAPLTPPYASPEQLRGEPVSFTSDIFSLGVTLHELLTGRLPQRTGPLPEPVGAADSGAHEAPRPLPRPIETALRRALAPEPRARYRTAVEFAESLERAAAASRLGIADAVKRGRASLERLRERRRRSASSALPDPPAPPG